jgi:hypothetical protein
MINLLAIALAIGFALLIHAIRNFARMSELLVSRPSVKPVTAAQIEEWRTARWD